jgi:class 3 adenylate cyclase
MTAYEAVHRTILVFDIEQSNHPMRTNQDRVVIHEARYAAVRTALKRLEYYHEDRGDGVLVLIPPEVPKGRLVSNLLARVEAALARHNAAMDRQGACRAAATQVRLRIAVHAGEVTFDSHGVVGAAVDHTFRLAEAPPFKSALAASTGVCALITSGWFFEEVVRHHPDAHPERFRRIETQVKETHLTAFIRVPGEIPFDEPLPSVEALAPQRGSGTAERDATRWLLPSPQLGRGPRWI